MTPSPHREASGDCSIHRDFSRAPPHGWASSSEWHSSSAPSNCGCVARSCKTPRPTLAGATWRLPLAVSLFVAYAGELRAEEFFPTRDENPMLRGFYLPLPSDSRADAGATVAATFSIANGLNAERRSTEELLVDGESDTLRLSYENSMAPAWRYRFSVPVVHDSGGFLDSPI